MPSGAAIRVGVTGEFYDGLGVCSHDENITETAVFLNVSIEPFSFAQAETAEAAEEIVKGDPYVEAGAVVTWKIRPLGYWSAQQAKGSR